MKKIIRTFFFFSKRERIGVLVLLALLIAFILIPIIYSFVKKEKAVDFSTFEKDLALLEKYRSYASSTQSSSGNAQSSASEGNLSTRTKDSLFFFDPNTATKEELLSLNIPPRLTNTILKYRNKGGKFFQARDLKKMYAIDDSLYLRLQPYIRISAFGQVKATSTTYSERNDKRDTIAKSSAPPLRLQVFDPNTADKNTLLALGLTERVCNTILKFRAKGGRFYDKKDLQKIYGLAESKYRELMPYIRIEEKPAIAQSLVPKEYSTSSNRLLPPATISIDINQADASEWQKLRGIGPAYSKRIVNFREKLGGFYSVEQVGETYGLPDTTFQKIKPLLKPSPLLRKIPLNSADAKTLAAHPYIRYQQANTIVAYRDNHGAFQRVEDIRKVRIFKEKEVLRLMPYLDLE